MAFGGVLVVVASLTERTRGSLAPQPVQAPKDVWPQFGQLSDTAASTELQALTEPRPGC